MGEILGDTMFIDYSDPLKPSVIAKSSVGSPDNVFDGLQIEVELANVAKGLKEQLVAKHYGAQDKFLTAEQAMISGSYEDSKSIFQKLILKLTDYAGSGIK
jgi:hypothetical protein